ncbi:hypothetical protein NDU88_005084 [Pleurodeles waltl]|uniref:Uncharacterized protein n=1 Tax=Pleurodeles waltl TaxID=8319 RepID=A0AAV7KZS8_PLEWA|nr:hypothetical protein NDU88_005084 [Pleurodeles waltl]
MVWVGSGEVGRSQILVPGLSRRKLSQMSWILWWKKEASLSQRSCDRGMLVASERGSVNLLMLEKSSSELCVEELMHSWSASFLSLLIFDRWVAIAALNEARSLLVWLFLYFFSIRLRIRFDSWSSVVNQLAFSGTRLADVTRRWASVRAYGDPCVEIVHYFVGVVGGRREGFGER